MGWIHRHRCVRWMQEGGTTERNEGTGVCSAHSPATAFVQRSCQCSPFFCGCEATTPFFDATHKANPLPPETCTHKAPTPPDNAVQVSALHCWARAAHRWNKSTVCRCAEALCCSQLRERTVAHCVHPWPNPTLGMYMSHQKVGKGCGESLWIFDVSKAKRGARGRNTKETQNTGPPFVHTLASRLSPSHKTPLQQRFQLCCLQCFAGGVACGGVRRAASRSQCAAGGVTLRVSVFSKIPQVVRLC